MGSSFPQPLLDLLRMALQALEAEPTRLCIENAKRIRYLHQLINIIERDPGDAGGILRLFPQ